MNDRQLWDYPEGYRGLEFLENTPAMGDAYYDKEGDRAIIVYRDKILVYSKRLDEIVGKTARCFDVCDVVNK